MPACVKIPCPPGPLSLTFHGSPAVVTAIREGSPLVGKVREGYIVQSLELPDGTVLQGEGQLGHAQVVATLKQYADQPGRKLKLLMALPDSAVAKIEAGVSAESIEISGYPPLIKSVKDKSLAGIVRAGMVVEKVVLSDGMELVGHSDTEVKAALADTSTERTLFLLQPGKPIPAKQSIFPAVKEVPLPQLEKLGLGFTNTESGHTLVSKVSIESPVIGKVRAGMVVDSLVCGPVHYRGFQPPDLVQVLLSTSKEDQPERSLILKSPLSQSLPSQATIQMPLPLGGLDVLQIEFAKKTNKPIVQAIGDGSPLVPIIRRGQEVFGIILEDGMEYEGLSTSELSEVFDETAETENRSLIVINHPEPVPDGVEVELPSGKLGINLVGTPPIINKILPNSPLNGKVYLGQAVDTLTLPPKGETFYQMSAKDLLSYLQESRELEGRKVRLINPDTTELSSPPTPVLPDQLDIVLPVQQSLGFGMTFKGGRIVITSVRDHSPLLDVLPVGMAVDTLTLRSGQVFMELTATSFREILKDTSDQEGRILRVKNPNAEGVTFAVLPDRVEVPLPAGKLGISFSTTTELPIVTKLSPSCPIPDKVPIGMFADALTFADGTVVTGLSSLELAEELKATASEENRTLVLKNPRTTKPTPADVVLPDSLKVVLPQGKLGVSFHSTSMGTCLIKRVEDESPVRGKIRAGMVVDEVCIVPANPMHGLTAQEVVRVLHESRSVSGRTMTLKNPETSRLSMRNVTVGVTGDLFVNADATYDDESFRG